MDSYGVGKMELCEHECDPHSLTRTRTLKCGWFGLTRCVAERIGSRASSEVL